ncbi:MAG: RecX family transcriptional regulator [Candidatus Omnitrophica bacterium]|nr:RecX family transcriptional regulator [Candidatus Omnitrophota bacterium]
MVDKVNKRVLNQGEKDLVKNDICFNKALKHSLLLLKYRARTKKEICQRLKQKGWKDSVIIKVVNRLEDNKFLNDKEFVDLFIESSLSKGWGPKRVFFYLKKFGIEFDFRKNINEQDDNFIKVLRKNIKIMISSYSSQDYEMRRKKFLGMILRSMVAKGFEAEVVFREMNSLEEEYFEDK